MGAFLGISTTYNEFWMFLTSYTHLKKIELTILWNLKKLVKISFKGGPVFPVHELILTSAWRQTSRFIFKNEMTAINTKWHVWQMVFLKILIIQLSKLLISWKLHKLLLKEIKFNDNNLGKFSSKMKNLGNLETYKIANSL